MGEHQNVKLNRTVKAAVLTVSDTRDIDTDKGGQWRANYYKQMTLK